MLFIFKIPFVIQERVPDPSVDKTVPCDPELIGNVNVYPPEDKVGALNVIWFFPTPGSSIITDLFDLIGPSTDVMYVIVYNNILYLL